MSDVPYLIGQRIADHLRWTYKTERSLVGGIRRVTWHPKAGERKVKSGEFWPEVEAMPSRLVVSLGESRVTLYLGGTMKAIRIDAVGVSGDVHPSIMAALQSADVPDIVEATKEKETWFRENPEYRSANPNKKPAAKSNLNPSQIEV